MSKKTLSLYLVKNDVAEFDSVLTKGAMEQVQAGVPDVSQVESYGDSAKLYAFPGYSKPPDWVADIKSEFVVTKNLSSRSPCAVVMFKKSKRIFVLSYSYGHMYLDDAKLEPDFGLRVAINFVEDREIRGVGKSNLGLAIRDFSQAAGKKDLSVFGVNDALDLIRKVSGNSSKSEFADVVGGSLALRFSREMEFADVPEVAAEALLLFQSDSYKTTPFAVIDLLLPISDPVQEEVLDGVLVESLKKERGEFEIGFPDFISDDLVAFRFESAGISEFYPDLSLDLYNKRMGDRLGELDIETLKRHRVAAYGEENPKRSLSSWSMYNCLIGSQSFEGRRYAINEGKWYRVDDAFREQAEASYKNVVTAKDKKLTTFKKKATDEKGVKGAPKYESEKDYNRRMAEQCDYICMDGKLVHIPNKMGPGIELCDLLDISGRRLIHVKKSSRSSSILSHFFKQGTNSAELLRAHEYFRSGSIEKVEAVAGKAAAKEFEKAISEKWTVEYRIADYPRATGKFNIPFFSKLSLRDEIDKLTAMSYNVKVGFIGLPEIVPAVK